MSHRASALRTTFLLFLGLALVAPARSAAQDGRFADMEARAIGPAGMSGRVTDVEVVLSDPTTIYVGGATGGVFRSRDAGLTWQPLFDDQDALGIGAIAVFQPNPDIVWVGTGEGNPRNSAGVGRGVYRSDDGGETWTGMGLEDSERISRVLTHPTDPDIVYVAALGPAWSDGDQRGVYRTTDGGESWERILWTNVRTGAADLVLDPANPDHLIAGMWEYRRDPWFFTSGGPGSGLFVTRDGGDSWVRKGEDEGLPPGELGRIGLAIAPSDPDVVYALVEAERSEFLRSDDGGGTWRTLSDRDGIVPRPFYYADLRVDPTNENRIYSLHGSAQVTEDQGRTWRTVVPSQIIHGDVHELWIDPADSRRMILGEDGGIAFTYDRGAHWRFVENLPLAQFYHITVDMETPYNVYGGLQDNGSWYGPSTVWESRGILNAHWRRVGGGDGFSVMDDPSDASYGYSMSQQGSLQRFDKVTGLRVGIQPVHPQGIPLRFNWNAALTLDPHDSTSIYLGSQFVHRSRDHGASWDVISPDLTTNDPEKQRQDLSGGLTLDATGAENHTTIVSIEPSPLEPGVIWVGTDDGNIQVTRDDGGSWTEVGRNVQGVPDATWVPHVEPSRHDPATAFAVFDNHRRGDWTTYVYRTTDYGRSWTPLAPTDVDGFAHVIVQDPEVADLLFLGTEFGLYMSTNGGSSWDKYTSGVPSVPIRDIVVHPRDADLVLGTHGRGILIVDDIRPLRALARGTIGQGAGPVMIDPPPARAVEVAEAIGYRSTGHAMQQAPTRPFGALLSFWNPDPASGRVEVRDPQDRLIWNQDVDVEAGVNRVVWDLRPGGDADEAVFSSFLPVMPGRYTVTVDVEGRRSSADLEVAGDPRRNVARGDLVARHEAVMQVSDWWRTAQEAEERLRDADAAVSGILETLPDNAAELRRQGRAVQGSVREALRDLFDGPECQGICGGDPVAGAVRAPLSGVAGRPGAPTPTDRLLMEQAREALGRVVDRVNSLFADEVAGYREALQAAGYTPLPDPAPLRPGG